MEFITNFSMMVLMVFTTSLIITIIALGMYKIGDILEKKFNTVVSIIAYIIMGILIVSLALTVEAM